MGLKLNTTGQYLAVLYTIDGIYGEVTHGIAYGIENGEVIGLNDLTDLKRSNSFNVNINDYINNPLIPRFSVLIKTDNSDFSQEEFTILGLPLGLTMEDYFRMALLRGNGKTKISNTEDIKISIDPEKFTNELKKSLETIFKEFKIYKF